jgi:hypothetical protein
MNVGSVEVIDIYLSPRHGTGTKRPIRAEYRDMFPSLIIDFDLPVQIIPLI